MQLDSQEAHILSEVARQLVQLLEDSPDDPAAQRLFPNAYEEAAAQAEYSRFTRAGLAERKLDAARTVIEALSDGEGAGIPNVDSEGEVERRVTISIDASWLWLTFFTDLRMVLAERMSADPDAEEHAMQQALYEWLAYLQDSLVQAVDTARD